MCEAFYTVNIITTVRWAAAVVRVLDTSQPENFPMCLLNRCTSLLLFSSQTHQLFSDFLNKNNFTLRDCGQSVFFPWGNFHRISSCTHIAHWNLMANTQMNGPPYSMVESLMT